MADINEPQNQIPTAPELEASTAPVTELPETADPETDHAVDDIMKHDGDEVLEVQDDIADKAVAVKQGKWQRFKKFNHNWWSNPRKRWSTIAGIIIVLALVFALPITRYNLLGLVLQSRSTITIIDMQTGKPVSGVEITLGGKHAETNADGKASMRTHLGSHTLQVSKKYYTSFHRRELVGFSGNNFGAALKALGRQINVKVVNKISGKPVASVEVKIGSASAKTNKNGQATLVTPSSADTQTATMNAVGYNTAKVDITASGDLVKNTFQVVPAGKLYFLSNLNGSLDVVKTNLDGSDRQMVLAGTGSEDRQNTSLLASRDWKYLALLSKRSGDKASVYLIDTTQKDKLTTVDQGNADFSFVGWAGDRFVYQVTRNTVSDWQANRQALKSLDATNGQTLLLDQTQASGTAENDFAGQTFGSPYIIGNQIVYAKNWISSYKANELNGKQAELNTINADGTAHKVVKSFAPAVGYQGGNLATELYEPDGLYVQFYDGAQYQYYDYDAGKLTADSSMTNDIFYGTPYPTYLLSPSGNSTFWAEERDGKNTLLVGDQDGKSSKQIATLSAYNTYGWFTDDYLLVSKGNSELYIMSATGGTTQKITDYYKPAITYNGYGGGYGGR